jgi:predicted GNAT superfamily acetyltransferase
VPRTLDLTQLEQRAAAEAADAATRAGVEIVPLEDLDALTEASDLIAEVWGTGPDDPQIRPELLRAMTHAGNYAAGAYANGELVGTIIGFLGRDDEGTYLHSHILGVSVAHRGANIGFALKSDQRAWALARGIDKVTWTFDPLVRRNAHFNLQKLGAHADDYLESFYGSMRDGINAGDESDRLLAVWRLSDDKATEAANGKLDEPKPVDASKALQSDADGEPQSADVSDATVVCATPEDIVDLRRTDPGRALRWRVALRDSLGAAMHDGYSVTGFTRSGWYVLSRADTAQPRRGDGART